MKRYQAAKFFKTTLIVCGIVGAVLGVVVGLSYLIDADRVATQQALCAPDQMEHSFLSDHKVRAVCIKDGKLYLSDKVK